MLILINIWQLIVNIDEKPKSTVQSEVIGPSIEGETLRLKVINLQCNDVLKDKY